jgi:hypothetical protein
MFERLRATIRFWRYNTHPAKMEHRSREVVLFGGERALEYFNDAEFRRLILFEKHSEEEQNRFFNELTVANLVLLMLLIDQCIQETSEEDRREYLQALRAAVPEYYKGFLHRIKVPEKLAALWEKLIALRYDEYSKDMLEFRRRFFEEPDEKINELVMDNRVMIFQTVIFGLYSHLMRGKIRKRDPLYLNLQKYLVQIHKGFIKRI